MSKTGHVGLISSRLFLVPRGPIARWVLCAVCIAVTDYVSGRADAPTVVLLHGLLLAQASWQTRATTRRRYGRAIRVITYDHRGRDRSTGVPMPTYETSQLAADPAQVLTAMQITGPLTLAGHSMGGMTALAYTRARQTITAKTLSSAAAPTS
jgi:pimeloyl-ACP methyl ester carboxylesterase